MNEKAIDQIHLCLNEALYLGVVLNSLIMNGNNTQGGDR